MKTTLVPPMPNLNTDNHRQNPQATMSLDLIGLLEGLPVSREFLAIVALNQFYRLREQIVEHIAMKLPAQFIGEAHDIANALVITERLLSSYGVRTELDGKAGTGIGETWLEAVEDIFGGAHEPVTKDRKQILALFAPQFGTIIKQARKQKPTAAKR